MYATNVPRPGVGAATPADRGLAYQDGTFGTDDAVTLSGWYLPSTNRAAVVLLRGASSTRTDVLDHAAVFAVLGSLSMQDFKQLGVGLAVAILLGATVVRGVLLPSVLTLLGDRTWYLPRWLSWLPNPQPGPAPQAAPEPEPVAAGSTT